MKSTVAAFILLLAMRNSPPCAAWDAGQQWQSSINYSMDFVTDSVICNPMEVDVDGSATGTWTYMGVETRNHPMSGVSIDMHRFDFSGSGPGNAAFDHDDYCFGYSYWEQPLTITLWLDGNTLNPITVSLYHTIDGTWDWFLGGEYSDHCTGYTRIDTNYDPFYPDFDWPLDPGKTWQIDVTTQSTLQAYWYGWIGDWGQYWLDPTTSIDTQTSITSLVGEQIDINDCLSYPVNHSDDAESDWCPESGWYSKRTSLNINWDLQIPATPHPTATPFTPVPTPTPTATTGPCAETGASISMPYVYYSTGYNCWVNVRVCNPGSAPMTGYPLFVVLEAYGLFFFAPGFTQEPYCFREASAVYPPGLTELPVLQEFMWPVGAGSGTATWYAVFLEENTVEIFGSIGHRGFFWNE
ncbi:hypothetical protein JW823_06075 [bacterium]|nr:hypothetical protein [candidate division CSSED10-310 bacterium]